MNLLVVAPHPDDEVIGCGGLMAKVKAEGGEVYVVVITVGDHLQYGGESITAPRVEEATQANEFLGTKEFWVEHEDDEFHLRLDTLPQKDLIDCIEFHLHRSEPTIVALPSPSYHQDHRAVHQAGITACRPRPSNLKPFASTVLSYEVTSWGETFTPNFYVDISDFLDKKLEALKLYKSQMREDPHPLSVENIKRLNELRGREICVEAAEAFVCHRTVI
jgi:LmbE family N-acetylglucosaminyl deacetylase